MRYFALHVKTGSEITIKNTINEIDTLNYHVFCPQRELIIRKSGKTHKVLKPLFPGYIFVKADSISSSFISELKKINGFFQVLPSNREVKSIPENEMKVINSLFRKDHKAVLSKARFDENNKIVIIDGPLKGKEGIITKVDKRKGRAKVVLNAFNREHTVDLGFEILSSENTSS